MDDLRSLLSRCATRLAPAALCGVVALWGGGCGTTSELEQNVKDVDIAAFSTPPTDHVPEVVATPLAEVEPPSTTDFEHVTTLADGTKVTRAVEAVSAMDPATGKPMTEFVDETSSKSLRVGQRWPVECLVGQINGRPIFAEEIFKQVEAAVLLAARDPNADNARQQVDAIVRKAFRQQVESELILAEAESRLTPEMRQGLLGWLKDIQEQTIAQHGGTRSGAEEAMEDEMQMSVEEYVTATKNRELTRDILRRKVDPRVVVSWRDVERLYSQRRSAYAPDPLFRLGRIRLSKEQQADKVETVKKMLAEKKPFQEVADAVGMPEHGFWRAVTATGGRMNVGDMTDDLQKVVGKLGVGDVSEPLEQRTTISWFSVIGTEVPRSISIFDPDLQLNLRGELRGTQERMEQARYIQSLQKRWLGASITKMELRLVQMARERYLDPLKTLKGTGNGASQGR